MTTITVLVTLLNDKRVLRALESLAQQTRAPDAVLVADGGSTDGTLELVREFCAAHPRFRVEHHAGSVAQTRNSALRSLTTEITAFLDADEVAPSDWLEKISAPIVNGEVDYAGGPTRPLGEPRSNVEAYLNDFEAWFYPTIVAKDIAKLPMGNSAWHRRVWDRIGTFDARLTWGGEDYDVNVRAARAGLRGKFVPEAWVFHDQGNVNTLRKLLRRKYRYNKGAAVAYLKNGVLGAKAGKAARNTAAFRHRYEAWNYVIQPVALTSAWWAWRRMHARK